MSTKPEIIKTTTGVSLSKNDPQYTIHIEMDFAGVSRETLIAWAMYDRKVKLASALRTTSNDYLRELSTKSLRIHAAHVTSAGQTLDKQIDALVAAVPGLDRDGAKLLLTDPTAAAKLLGGK